MEGDQTRLQNDAQIAPAEVAPERIAMSTTESIRKAAGITKKLSSESEKDKSLTLIVNATQTSTDVRKDLRPKNEATTEHLKIQTNAEKAKDERPEAATEAPAQFFIINKDNNEEEEQSSPQKPLDPGPGTPPVTFDYMSSPPNSFRKITFNIPHFIQKPLQPSDFFPKEFGSSDFTPKPLAAPFLETEGVDDPAQTDGSGNTYFFNFLSHKIFLIFDPITLKIQKTSPQLIILCQGYSGSWQSSSRKLKTWSYN